MAPPNNNDKKRRRRRPSPPPPPPQSLIDLLQNDSQVLHYFTALQANLDADVDEWKQKAQDYEQKWKNEMSSRKKKTKKRAPTKRKEGETHQNGTRRLSEEGQAKEAPITTSTVSHDEPTVAVEDAILLELGSSSSDEPMNVGDKEEESAEATKHVGAHAPVEDEKTKEERHLLFTRIRDAYRNLERLGVPLVWKETPQDKTSATTVGDGAAIRTKEEVLRRRENEHVVADLLYALHTLTRLQMSVATNENVQQFAPFLSEKLVPCCDYSEGGSPCHPAAEGKALAIQALEVLFTYCGDAMRDRDWDGIFSDEKEDAQSIRVGMRDRRSMVEDMLTSLRGEISSGWAIQDRSSRLQSTGLHFDGALDEDEGDGENPFMFFGSKSQARLSSLVERRVLAQIVAHMDLYQGRPESVASLVWAYVMSTMPVLKSEDYPRLPPVLSFCTLEGLLVADLKSKIGTRGIGLSLFRWWKHDKSNQQVLPYRALALAIHATAQIYRERMQSFDSRIADISRVELAAFERLRSVEGSWLRDEINDDLDRYLSQATEMLQKCVLCLTADNKEHEPNRKHVREASLSFQLLLTLVGSSDVVKTTCQKAIGSLLELASSNSSSSHEMKERGWAAIIYACSVAICNLQVSLLDEFRAKISSAVPGSSALVSSWMVDKIRDLRETAGLRQPPSFDLVVALSRSLAPLADAEESYRFIRSLLGTDPTQSHDREREPLSTDAMEMVLQLSRVPTIRVINLERRVDRMKAFVVQAQSERLMVAKAVASLDVKDDSNYMEHDALFWGNHAFDGKGTVAEVETRLSTLIKPANLNTHVETHWRPSDLKAFDKDAREDEALLPMSPSERACALSHIASWKGTLRSLEMQLPSESPLRLIQISGYASGRPLLSSNEHMPPALVCVILEDDAILVDRFADRLSALLEELPRDFHFCSLGYSRPKTAPMPEYSSQLGIPSCIWYLTGYVLSLEGARYLLDSLPVRGPVDSWIGLKMCGNWDNIFGQIMGVGVHARSSGVELPSRGDLARILKFRAFAALTPLCHQKVGATALTSTVGRSWRQRDTDITYSGN
jgi:GR25 family glycosyltransferase involved in LPS biosynthesis